MTHLAVALATLEATQDAFCPISDELTWARAALKRSKSKANVARYIAASEAFDAALDACNACHAAVDAAEELDAAEAAAAEAAELAALEPTLF